MRSRAATALPHESKRAIQASAPGPSRRLTSRSPGGRARAAGSASRRNGAKATVSTAMRALAARSPRMTRLASGIAAGAILNSRSPSPTSSSAYATAKGGIIAFTRKLSFELGPYGVTVNAIAPSLTLSPRLRPRWDRMSEEDRARESARVPLGRVALPEDQARVICFLASSDADFVTGVTIDVNGGQ